MRSTRRGWRQKTALENSTYFMGETIQDDRIASELAAADKKKIEDAIQQDIHLLDVNQSEEADELRRQDDGARVHLLAEWTMVLLLLVAAVQVRPLRRLIEHDYLASRRLFLVWLTCMFS
ncbi:unnamed protein product [Musa acuminata subsp. malaccensis]|uniref:(wild Malaysian banana) hypothetical protein n=1 Tax=Musa acuminata subsp. malaccensis TaxID=214687 RepID=A0A804JAI0_MUSAM|nr:unnamed protein product [Musa acuminata subsp. malaccensis]